FITRHITVECTLLALFSLAVRGFRQIPTAVAVAFSAVFIDTFITRHITVECTLLALFSLAVRGFRQIPTAVAVA
ncbi:hypothetical protein C7D73_30715, partial [Klebsiella pneumoniae]